MSLLDAIGLGAGTQGVPTADQMNVVSSAPGHDYSVLPAYIQWGDPSAQNFLIFDAVMSETHTRVATVTTHTVETGVAVTDHVRPEPDELALEVIVSNTPLPKANDPDMVIGPVTLTIPQPNTFYSISGAIDALATVIGLKPAFPTTLNAIVASYPDDHDYIRLANFTLTNLRNNALLLTVRCPRAEYDNMVLKSVVMLRDPELGSGAARFRLEMVQIRTVASSVGAAPQPTVASAATTQSNGGQEAKDDNTPQTNTSVLDRFLGIR